MTAPEKLHVIVGSLCGPRAFVSADEATWDRERLGRDSSEWVTKPQAYVREDVAEQRVGMAKREAEIAVMDRNAMDYERDDERKRADKAEAEATALRRERDALRLALEKIVALQPHEPAEGESRSSKSEWWEGCQYGAQCGKYAASKIAKAALEAAGKGVG